MAKRGSARRSEKAQQAGEIALEKHRLEELRRAVAGTEHLTVRNRVQFPLYLEVGDLTVLKAVAKFDKRSVQDVLRELIGGFTTRRLRELSVERPTEG